MLKVYIGIRMTTDGLTPAPMRANHFSLDGRVAVWLC
jgi:hypothetical protein